MLLLDGIISAGFDGGNLIGGLATHVRNVMMAKDEQTLPLLHVSERQKAKYAEQAKKCPTEFLYKALRIMNDCDINYRQSGNKRLLVELTLIEMAQLTQSDDDTTPSGHCPKRLKSLFKTMISAQPKTAKQVAVVVRTAKSKQAAAISTDNSFTTTSAITERETPSAATKRKNSVPEPMIPDSQEAENISDNKEFTNDQLLIQWIAMCARMPQQMTGIAARMKNMTPVIADFPNVEVVVDNEILLEDISKIKGRIRNTLAMTLKNSNIQLSLKLAKPEDIKRIPTNRERFDMLIGNNDAFKNLVLELGLELS